MNKKMLPCLMLLPLFLLTSCAVNHSVIRTSSSADRTTRFESSRVIQVGDAGVQTITSPAE